MKQDKYKVVGKQVFYLQDKEHDKWLVKETFKNKTEAEKFIKDHEKQDELDS